MPRSRSIGGEFQVGLEGGFGLGLLAGFQPGVAQRFR